VAGVLLAALACDPVARACIGPHQVLTGFDQGEAIVIGASKARPRRGGRSERERARESERARERDRERDGEREREREKKLTHQKIHAQVAGVLLAALQCDPVARACIGPHEVFSSLIHPSLPELDAAGDGGQADGQV